MDVPDGVGQILAGAQISGRVFLGTCGGLLKVEGTKATWFDEFDDLGWFTGRSRPPAKFGLRVAKLAADGGLNVWLVGGALNDVCRLFSTDERLWANEFAGQPLPRSYPKLPQWSGGVLAIAGDPRRGGLWTCGMAEGHGLDIAYVDSSLADLRQPGKPEWMHVGHKLRPLTDIQMAGDMQGRLWLSGDSLDGASLRVLEGGRLKDVTPPRVLLRDRRFTQLAVDPRGSVYAATDGVGVLVYGGEKWQAHAVNTHLAPIAGTDLRPANCIALDGGGNLWVANGYNLVCWSRDS